MSARPKLIQEGSPLNINPAKSSSPNSGFESGSGSKGGSSLLQASGGKAGGNSEYFSRNSKYRLVVGGADDDDRPQQKEINDDLPTNETYYRENDYYNHNHNHNHGGGRGYYGQQGQGRNSFYGGRNNRGGRSRGRGRYGYNPRYHGRGRYNNHSFHNSFNDDFHHDSYNNGFDQFDHPHHNSEPFSTPYNESYSDPNKNFHEPQGSRKGNVQTRLVIGGNDALNNTNHAYDLTMKDVNNNEIIPQTYNEELHQIERMEGVISLDDKKPLVVMDGANISYAYADAIGGNTGEKREPDIKGLQVAADYFLHADVRVLIVLPATWFRIKPRPGDHTKENAIMLTEKIEILHQLKERGLLVAAPPRDDDDAYALTIARREDSRAKTRGEGAGYVLSNDMFRDAMSRDDQITAWLQDGFGRISYAFCDMGSLDDHGDRILDLIPNPRHPLVATVEKEHNK
mmetsp:Transcript_8510/g.12325  ORF Transcript_8510/g.12325 Transcript_8510/m.12325 type:complete len:456 (-) Transcript_8510:665-2032(-)|eukprot:CAMPEP_0202449858 /NCGR_PEP_ID=MMETSP1360-20130828/8540_1 /ASSEMBLY_ACC=CAM_ASM_000848 /TAXON_ID=515479 /ORGANISM="Licmophora paradoxa, Strain CCMP2313" /LENGTH=455 /DNA_ID=CAMNT_0049067919 /DNA_START=79 /DNA_END=1446 /DNA_ORIENTATION=-